MDPNTILINVRDAVTQYRRARQAGLPEMTDPDDLIEFFNATCDRLAASIDALDGWLSAGGFLPDVWAIGRCSR